MVGDCICCPGGAWEDGEGEKDKMVDGECHISYIVISLGFLAEDKGMAIRKTKSQKIDWADFNVKVAIAYGVAIIAFLLMLVVFKVV
ncbi:hypothetical protein HYS82_02485 [Candidatus Amesbacteria bacterium]|nr:hypothetical protein [Candidatus Amesbacteria bacterium]